MQNWCKWEENQARWPQHRAGQKNFLLHFFHWKCHFVKIKKFCRNVSVLIKFLRSRMEILLTGWNSPHADLPVAQLLGKLGDLGSSPYSAWFVGRTYTCFSYITGEHPNQQAIQPVSRACFFHKTFWKVSVLLHSGTKTNFETSDFVLQKKKRAVVLWTALFNGAPHRYRSLH